MWTEMIDFRMPLLTDVEKTDRIADAEADEDNISIRIGQRSTSVTTELI